MIATLVELVLTLVQGGAVPASAPASDGMPQGVAYVALSAVTGALVWLAKAWRDSQKESTATAVSLAKENAERIVAQQRECNDRNDRTVATVDSICDRFSETQINSTKVLAETVTAMQAMVREQREAHERREERLEQVLRAHTKT